VASSRIAGQLSTAVVVACSTTTLAPAARLEQLTARRASTARRHPRRNASVNGSAGVPENVYDSVDGWEHAAASLHPMLGCAAAVRNGEYFQQLAACTRS